MGTSRADACAALGFTGPRRGLAAGLQERLAQHGETMPVPAFEPTGRRHSGPPSGFRSNFRREALKLTMNRLGTAAEQSRVCDEKEAGPNHE